MSSEVVRVDGVLLQLAKAAGEAMGRSAASQISHWARLGRAFENADIPTSAIHAVLARQREFDSLDEEDQKAVAALWEARIAERIANLDLAAEFETTGAAYAELDEDGNVFEVPASKPATVAATRAVRGAESKVSRQEPAPKRAKAGTAKKVSAKTKVSRPAKAAPAR